MTGTGECSIKVNHGLLGYERGHRLLASSKELKSTSKHILLQFSDRSVDVNEIPKSGYLTGYPLDEDGLYVIARTWAAPEIPRPGCIWTHSLLISFTELAQLDDPRRLLPLFRRPAVSGERNEYTSLFEIELLPQLVAPRGKSQSRKADRRQVIFRTEFPNIHDSQRSKISRIDVDCHMGSAVAEAPAEFPFLHVDSEGSLH